MKKLLFGFHSVVGRNSGRISSYHRGGGHKKLYRFVDHFRNLYRVSGKIVSLDYDPTRSAKLALVAYTNGVLSYTLALSELKVGDFISSNLNPPTLEERVVGLACPLRYVKVGIKVSSIELFPSFGAQIARAAGTYCTLIRKYDKVALLKLSSGEFRFFSLDCFCVIGSVSAPLRNRYFGKAGISRWHGWKPVVRGRAMNPVDHPHGGRTNGGMTPSTPWGLIAKGIKTSRSTSSLRLKSSKL